MPELDLNQTQETLDKKITKKKKGKFLDPVANAKVIGSLTMFGGLLIALMATINGGLIAFISNHQEVRDYATEAFSGSQTEVGIGAMTNSDLNTILTTTTILLIIAGIFYFITGLWLKKGLKKGIYGYAIGIILGFIGGSIPYLAIIVFLRMLSGYKRFKDDKISQKVEKILGIHSK